MEKMTFWGYRRPDGRVGIRNKILILPASVCASDTTRIIASQVESAVTFNNQNGCSQVPSDQQFTMDVMAGYAANPNVYGTVVVSLGCENCQMDLVLDAIKERTNKPIRHFIIQENGGTISTVEKAVRAAKEMAQEASLLQKEEFDFSELIIGTECGGSDPTSGRAANVLIGEMNLEAPQFFLRQQNLLVQNIFWQDAERQKKSVTEFTRSFMTMSMQSS